jgi:hypothetical protein
MITPKEKAEELFEKFNNPDTKYYPYVHNAQQCALIAVDEILDNNLWFNDEINNNYWFEVRQEIEKL